VFDGEALARPGVKDAGFWEEVVGQLLDPFPGEAILLAAPPKRAPPEAGNMEPEGRKCREVCRHCVVSKEAGDDLPQPRSLHWDGLMHSLPQFAFYLLELGRHAIASGLPLEEEVPSARFTAEEREAQEVEGFRFAEPALLSSGRRMAAELDQASLFRM
jgi:hypothetical protein